MLRKRDNQKRWWRLNNHLQLKSPNCQACCPLIFPPFVWKSRNIPHATGPQSPRATTIEPVLALEPGNHNYWSLHTPYSLCSTREATTMRSRHALQERSSTVKNKQINVFFFFKDCPPQLGIKTRGISNRVREMLCSSITECCAHNVYWVSSGGGG